MSNEDDMDWLYRREPEQPEQPEPTAIMPMARPEPAQRPPAAPPPPPPAPPSTPGRRRRRRRRPVLRLVGTLVALWLVYLIAVPVIAWNRTETVTTAPEAERPADQPGRTILLVGSDARADGSGGARADTMMLLTVPRSGKPVLLSLPRDSYVSIPGYKDQKLNAAYSFGGPQLLVAAIEENTGVRVDGYLEVGFEGVVDIVDAVGGIEVCPAFDIDDEDSHLTISAGCQTVDGETALGYARMRKSDPKGDLGRVERQREVIGSVTREVMSPMSVINPVRYWQVGSAASQALRRGEDTGLLDLGSVATGFIATTTGAGISMTVPVDGTGNVSGVGSVVFWDDGAASEVFAAIASGDTTSLEKYQS